MKKIVKCCFHMYFLMSSEILVNFDHYLVEYAFPYLQNRSKVGKLQWRFCLWFGWPSSTLWSGSVGSKNQGMQRKLSLLILINKNSNNQRLGRIYQLVWDLEFYFYIRAVCKGYHFNINLLLACSDHSKYCSITVNYK